MYSNRMDSFDNKGFRDKAMNEEKELNVTIPIELDLAFRIMVMHRYGYKRGNIQKCVIEALSMWIEVNKGKKVIRK